MTYTAVVLGGTGLVGSHLVNILIKDHYCKTIVLVTRRKTEFSHTKIQEHIINFNNIEDYHNSITGDVLFSCLGTTRAQAKNKANHYMVDYTYQYHAAQAARSNGIPHYILVSSPWSNISSKNYYRKMKAELERNTITLSFPRMTILKPNGLNGKRKQPRFGERLLMPLFIALAKVFPSLKKHQPIEAELVAKAMLKSYYNQHQNTLEIHTRNDILDLLN